MKISFIAFIIILLHSLSGFAQNNSEPRSTHKENLAVKVEYFGELVLHPGLSVGLDYTVSRNNWVTIHWSTDIGGFWHRWNNTSAFLKTSLGSRFAMGSLFADVNIGAGYMHSWAAGKVYQRAENGGVEKATNWGHSHFMPNTSLLFGWDGTRKANKPWTVSVGPEVYLQSSTNHIFLPHVAAKLGVTYKLKS